jgi:hypothetical protein
MNCTLTPAVGVPGEEGRESLRGGPSIVLDPGEFLRETVAEEATRLGVTVEELVTFAVLYYLADLDGERVARVVPLSIVRATD